MSSTADLLTALLSPERNESERLASLYELRPFFHDEAVLTTFARLLETEPSHAIRRAILSEIAYSEHTAFNTSEPCRAALFHAAAFETEATLRELAITGLLRYIGTDARTETLFAALLPDEFSPQVQQIIAEGLARLPRPADSTIEMLAKYAAQAPAHLQHSLAIILGRTATPIARMGLVALLQPATDPTVRARVIEHLSEAPILEPDVAAQMTSYLNIEHDPALWSSAFFLLLRFQDVPAPVLSQAVEIMLDRTDELSSVIPALRDRLHAQPALAQRLALAFESLPRANARQAILDALAEADLPEITARALADSNAGVRAAGIRVASRTLNRHAQVLLPALLKAYGAEPLAHHRALILDALQARPSLEPEHQSALLARFPKENDPTLRVRLAPIVLSIPPSPENETVLLEAWTSLVGDPVMPPSTRAEVIKRLHTFAFADSPAFAGALVLLLEHTREIRELENIFPLLRKVTRDPRPLHPVLLRALYRFVDAYPRAPLDDIVKYLFTDATAISPDLQKEVPYVVALTGASHLLKAADSDTRKNTVYTDIHAAMLEGDSNKARSLLDASFRDGVLKKSTVIQLFCESLVHPSYNDVYRSIFKILEKSKLMTPEIADAMFLFIKTYPASSDTYEFVCYLQKHAAPVIADYSERVRHAITQASVTRHSLWGEDPRDDTGCSGTGWGDRARRAPWHSKWYLPHLLEEYKERPPFMRDILLTPPANNTPWYLSLHLHALNLLERKSYLEESDFQAAGTCLRFCREASGSLPDKTGNAAITPNLRPLAEFAAFLCAVKWPALNGNWGRNRTGDLAPETRQFAAEVYDYQFANWLEQGGEMYWERIAPLAGMDASHLAQLWANQPDYPALFARSYAQLIAPDQSPLPPGAPKPNATYKFGSGDKPPRGTFPKPHFTAAEKYHQVTEFLAMTKPPTPASDSGRLRAAWKSLLSHTEQLTSPTFEYVLKDKSTDEIRAALAELKAETGA